MTVVTAEQQQQLAVLDAARAKATSEFEAVVPQLDAAQQQWEADVVAYEVTLPELRPDSSASDAAKQAARKVMELLKNPNRNAQQQQVVQDYYRNTVTRLFTAQRDAVAKAERERKQYSDSLPKCLVSVSTSNKRIVRILPRGNWMDESGEAVQPALPHYLPQPAIDGRELTRLDLAHWLVSRDNPLTARTTMNRLWEQFFGTGLSKTLNDLGTQGEPPFNPALLDWLACEFMDSGWDIKHMVRTIVNSATYKQVSSATPELVAADPYNRECGRQSAFRLDAELVRDTALAVSGLMVRTIGGPSVKPYQPDGYWENLNFPRRDYVPDKGEAQYRRGLYVWWQRTFSASQPAGLRRTEPGGVCRRTQSFEHSSTGARALERSKLCGSRPLPRWPCASGMQRPGGGATEPRLATCPAKGSTRGRGQGHAGIARHAPKAIPCRSPGRRRIAESRIRADSC